MLRRCLLNVCRYPAGRSEDGLLQVQCEAEGRSREGDQVLVGEETS